MKQQMQPAAAEIPVARKALTLPLWALAAIQTFGVWQMGVIYYSSRTFTLNGVMPLPVSVDTAVLPIALGYLAGAGLSWLFPHRVGLWSRIVTLVSLACILLMFAPLPAPVLAMLYYLTAFTCVVFIGVCGTLAIELYSLPTALRDGLLGTLVSVPFIALLHFGGAALDFRVFNGISAVIQLLILLGLSRIPLEADIAFLPKREKQPWAQGKRPPVLLLRGTFFTYAICCLCVLFSSTTAESLPNGIALYYLSGGVWATLFAWLCFKKKLDPMRIFLIFFSAAALGFVLWLQPIPALMPVSMVFQGVGVCLANLSWFLLAMLFERWPSRAIAPVAVLIALVTAMLHSGMLEAMRSNAALLYAVYAGIVLLLLIAYFLTEPYFRRVWMESAAESAPQDAPASDPADALPLETLTPREAEVLRLAVQGYLNEDIAKLLFISEHTVKSHIKSIYQKLGVHSRFELAVRYNRDGRPDEPQP